MRFSLKLELRLLQQLSLKFEPDRLFVEPYTGKPQLPAGSAQDV